MSPSCPRLGCLVLFAFTLGCGGLPLLSGQATESEICEDPPEQAMEGVPSFAPHTLDTTVRYDLAAALTSLSKSGLTTDVELSTFTLTATAGVEDLSFIHTARVTMGLADGGTLELLHYDRPPGVVGKTLNVNPAAGVNLITLGDGGALSGNLHLEGELPATDWRAKARPCFKANMSFALTP